jgi:hypothetical protein
MWYGLILALCCFVNAFDDVFTDLPSQFGGYNVFIGTGMDAQVDEVEYKDYVLQGPSDPKLKFAISQQSENDLWVSGKTIFVSIGGKDHIIYEKLKLSKMSVEYPLSYGVAYRKGFLFNPSTLCALNIGLGNEHVRYKYVTETVKANNLFVMGELDIIVGVLTQWGLEVGVSVAVSDAKVVLMNVVDKYQPPRYTVNGKVGIVYRHEPMF